MNSNRIDFKQPEDHSIKISPYWLLGFVEGEGYFSVIIRKTEIALEFGISQASCDVDVLKAIQNFLLDLPGKYHITRKDTNVVSLSVENKAKNNNSKTLSKVKIRKTDFITNVLLPFFDNLIWLSKKEKDYQDWRLILNIKNQGKHFTDEGKELIFLISKRMNLNRLSTNLLESKSETISLYERVSKLLSTPSNYEIQPDGKILIKSSGVYLKGRGNIGVVVLNEKGEPVYNFYSIQECALFFNISVTIVNWRLNKGSSLEHNGHKLFFKRVVPTE